MKSNNIFFQCCLCLWDVASKSLALPGHSDIIGSRKNHKLLTLRTPGEPAPCLFWEDFLALAGEKPLVIDNNSTQGWAIYQWCIVIWDEILRQILDIIISWYGVCVVFSWLKRLHCSKVMCFSGLTRLFLLFFYLPLPNYPHYWWLFIKKCYWVNMLWNHQ